MGYGKKGRAAADSESDALMANLSQTLTNTAHQDAVITLALDNIIPDHLNGRIGQAELLADLAVIEKAVAAHVAGSKDPEVPEYAALRKKAPHLPSLSPSARRLYNSCAGLANTYIANGGYADSPPKVTPANEDGNHVTRTGHRRYIAYRLAQPITGVGSVDVLIDKSRDAEAELNKSIGRVTENTAREDNTLAEYLLSIRTILNLMGEAGEAVNVTKLSRQTGIERTKLGRMITIVEAGGADDEALLTLMHELHVEDITSVQLVFQQPRAQWEALIRELEDIGPTAFRTRYRGDGPDSSLPAAKPAPPKGEGGGSDREGAAQESEESNRAAGDKPEQGLSDSHSAVPAKGHPSSDGGSASSGSEVSGPGGTGPAQTAQSSHERELASEDAQERGAKKLIEVLRSKHTELLEGLPTTGSYVDQVNLLIERLGEQ